MVRHSGTWAHKYSSEQVLAAGKALMEPFHQMSTQEFQDHAREVYDIDYRHALDWLNAARKFRDNPELLEGLTEAVIRRLAAPRLSMEITEQVIADIRTGRIDSNYRAVEQAIRRIKGKAKKKQETPLPDTIDVEEPPDMSDLQALLLYTRGRRAFVEQQLAEIQAKREALQQELNDLCAEIEQYQSETERFKKRIAAYELLLSVEE